MKNTSGESSAEELVEQPYKYGFVTEIEEEKIPKGIDEDVIRLISAKKEEPEFMLEFRLKAYEHWLKQEEPNWAKLGYPKIDYQGIIYYAAPKTKEKKRKSKWDQGTAEGSAPPPPVGVASSASLSDVAVSSSATVLTQATGTKTTVIPAVGGLLSTKKKS